MESNEQQLNETGSSILSSENSIQIIHYDGPLDGEKIYGQFVLLGFVFKNLAT